MKLADLRRFLVFADGEMVLATNEAKSAVAAFDESAATHRAIYTCQLHTHHHRGKAAPNWPIDPTLTESEREFRRLRDQRLRDANERRRRRSKP